MKKTQKPSKRSIKPIYKRGWTFLDARDQSNRVRALEVIRLMKDGESLSYASKSLGLDIRTAKAHLGTYIYKRERRWKAKKNDRIERGLTIYEKGRITSIVIADSEIASIIGEYFNDVQIALKSGNISILKKYRKLTIIDVNGKKHKFETKLEKIKEIELGKEDSESRDDIYDI